MKSDITWLTDRLPPIEKIKLRSEPDYYGISRIIANELGYKRTPRSFAQWLHGWIFTDPITDPRELTFWGQYNERILVTTEFQVEQLRTFGYKQVYAVGLPFIYAPSTENISVERQPNSLLVMPSHSSAYTDHTNNQEEYVQNILDFHSNFEHIVFCLHGSCIEKGYWISVLEHYNIPWVMGSSTNDRNALIRISQILQRFEVMTSNVLGSHIAYAAVSGCRVSITGQYASPHAEEYRNDPWYQKYPQLLEKHIALFQEAEIKKRFPQFFKLPHEAITHPEWGGQMVGKCYQRSAVDISKLLGWSMQHQIQGYTAKITHKITNLSDH